MKCYCWAEARIKIARMTLTIKLDRNWSSFQLANSTPPLCVTGSALAPSARMGLHSLTQKMRKKKQKQKRKIRNVVEHALSSLFVLSGNHPSPVPPHSPHPSFLAFPPDRKQRDQQEKQKQTQWTKAGTQQTETKQGATTTTTSNTQVAGNSPHRFARTPESPLDVGVCLFGCVAKSLQEKQKS